MLRNLRPICDLAYDWSTFIKLTYSLINPCTFSWINDTSRNYYIWILEGSYFWFCLKIIIYIDINSNFLISLRFQNGRPDRCIFKWVSYEQLYNSITYLFLICMNMHCLLLDVLRWEFIKENKKTHFRPNKRSRKKEKKTRSRLAFPY